MREWDAFNPPRNELVELQTCPACQRTFSVSPEGTTLVCPHCRALAEDETSVFACDTATDAASSPSAGSSSSSVAVVPVVLRLPGDELANAASATTFDEFQLDERPTEFDNRQVAVSAEPPADPGAAERGWLRPILWQMLVTYASVMTLLALFLGWQVYFRGPKRDLLDLPDLAPPAKKQGRVTTLIYVPSNKSLPRSHVLNLGESRRFGSVSVTPLRVARGPIRFRYFDPEVQREREPSHDVLQLHLRFDNVSQDQIFTPLDRNLVFSRESDSKNSGRFKANNFVRPLAGDDADDLYVYDLSPESDWVVVDQNLDQDLEPGSSVEVFIPTAEEGASNLQGPLVWRVHFRKGYHPVSFRGVTTLLEVRFDANDIQSDPPGEAVSRVFSLPSALALVDVTATDRSFRPSLIP